MQLFVITMCEMLITITSARLPLTITPLRHDFARYLSTNKAKFMKTGLSSHAIEILLLIHPTTILSLLIHIILFTIHNKHQPNVKVSTIASESRFFLPHIVTIHVSKHYPLFSFQNILTITTKYTRLF